MKTIKNTIQKAFFALTFVFALNSNAQSVAINTDGSTADASAILDLKSTNQGVLVPRLTQSQRTIISGPATGLMVYQTDATAGFYFYNGTAWTSMNGTAGTNGTNGQGLLIGGTANQVLAKIDGTDYNTAWVTPATSGTSLPTQTGNTGKVLSTDGTNASWINKSQVDLVAQTTTPNQVIPAGGLNYDSGDTSLLNTIIYNNVITAPSISGASYNAATGIYTVGQAGHYLITATVMAKTGATVGGLAPIIYRNDAAGTLTFSEYIWGLASGSINYVYGRRNRGMVTTVLYLNVGDVVKILVENLSSTETPTLTTALQHTRFTIVKL